MLHDGPVVCDGDECAGTCDFDTRTIMLDGTLDADMLWHAWLHEVTHAILNAIGRVKLNKDEGFVDSFSGALAQAFTRPKTKSARQRVSGAARPTARR